MTTPLSRDWVMSPDWVHVLSSNVTIAKDRGWFISYTTFSSWLSTFSGNLAISGVGSVSIPVKLPTGGRRGKATHSTIVIDEVLHVPDSTCNILGRGNFTDRYDISWATGGERQSRIKERGGRTVACFDEKKELLCLILSGPPVGPVTAPPRFLKLSRGKRPYVTTVSWFDPERARREAFKPYTDAEKAWLKQHFRDEFHFLRQYGYSIYEDEDREEGKRLLRSMMADERL